MEAPDDNFSLFKSVKRDLRNGSCLFSYFTRCGFPPFVWKVVVVFKFPQTKLLLKNCRKRNYSRARRPRTVSPNTYLTSWEKAERGRKIAHLFKASRFSYVRERRGSGVAAIILDNLSLFSLTQKGRIRTPQLAQQHKPNSGEGKKSAVTHFKVGIKKG